MKLSQSLPRYFNRCPIAATAQSRSSESLQQLTYTRTLTFLHLCAARRGASASGCGVNVKENVNVISECSSE